MEDNKMNRSLNSRHISMIAIGGAIGTPIDAIKKYSMTPITR
jgi:hypothetical protein